MKNVPLLSLTDVAALTKVSTKTVRRWINKELLKPIIIIAPGNKRGVMRFREEDVQFVLSGGRLDDHDEE